MEIKEKLKIPYPVIVEGKYDRLRLISVIDANIITTDGFGIFNKKEKTALLRALAKVGQVIVLTDSDGAGKLIRSHISGCLPADRIINLYTPEIFGKEKRKSAPGAEGILGVEGMTDTLLHEIFEKFLTRHPELTGDVVPNSGTITKLDFYEAGLSGGAGSSSRRDSLAESFGLPRGMTANALLDALNMIITRDEFIKATENSEE
jgi:ribonuclease M5